MTRTIRIAAVAAAAVAGSLMLGADAPSAHHGWGSYDAANPVTVEGPVTESSYQNPHAAIRIKGAQKEWTVTLAPTSRMGSRGAQAAVVGVGKTVAAYG